MLITTVMNAAQYYFVFCSLECVEIGISGKVQTVQHAVRGTQSALGQTSGGMQGDQQAALDDHTVAIWQVVREKLRAEFGATAYRYWLEPVVLIGVEAGVARLGAPTRAMRDWVTQHYLDRIQAFWHAEDANVHFVEINIISVSNGNAPANQVEPAASPASGSAAGDVSATKPAAKAKPGTGKISVAEAPC